MQVIVAFVRLQVRGEFGVTGDVAGFGPHAIASPSFDVLVFRG